MTQVTRHYTSECKTPGCSNPVVFHQDSYQKMQEQGVNPPAYCETCRKSRRQAHNLFVSYTRPRLDRSQAHTSLEGRERLYSNRDGQHKFNPNKFGVNLEHMQEVFQWFSQPQARCGVVRGQTGSGKSTAFVYYLLNPPEGYPHDFFTRDGQIWVTQPRIVAAEGISQYVGNILLGETFGKGGLIGTRTSQSKDYDPHNLVIMATDGSVLNILLEGNLDTVSMIFIDEVHQRSITIDLIMGLTLYWMEAFPKLKLMVASATIDPDVYQEYMGLEQTAVFDIPGKQPVGKDIIWPQTWNSDPQDILDYSDIRSIIFNLTEVSVEKTLWVLDMIFSKHVEHGDILVFFPGTREISDFLETLQKNLSSDKKITLHELHAQVSEKQKAVLEEMAPEGIIRIIASTNVAEASVTIEGLRHVIDCGLEKQDEWRIEEERTVILPIFTGRSNCKQRWGRVGRTTHGWVYPLYSQEQFETLFAEYLQPSIERSSLTEARLKLAQSGISLESIRLLGDPDIDELKRSEDVLISQNFIDRSGFITAQGQNALELDVQSVIDNLLIRSEQYGCFVEMATIIPFIRNGGYRNFFAWNKFWHTWTKYRVNEVYKTLLAKCRDDVEVFLKITILYQADTSQLESWFIDTDRLAKAQEETIEMVKTWSTGKKEINPEDLLRNIDLSHLDTLRRILVTKQLDSIQIVSEEFQFNSWIDLEDAPIGVNIRPPQSELSNELFGQKNEETSYERLFPKVCKPKVTQTFELHLGENVDFHEISPVNLPSEIHPPKLDSGALFENCSIGDEIEGFIQEYPLICDKYPIYTFENEQMTVPMDSGDLGLYCLSGVDLSISLTACFEGMVHGRPILSLLHHLPNTIEEVVEGGVVEYDDKKLIIQVESDDRIPLQLRADAEYLPEGFVPESDVLYSVQVNQKKIDNFAFDTPYREYQKLLIQAHREGRGLEPIHSAYRIVKKAQVRKIVPAKYYQIFQNLLDNQKVFWDVPIMSKNRGGFLVQLSIQGHTIDGFLPFRYTKEQGYIPENGNVALVPIEIEPFLGSITCRLVDTPSIYRRYQGMMGQAVTAIAGRAKKDLGQFFHLSSGVNGLVFHKNLSSSVPEGIITQVVIDQVKVERKRISLRIR